jgi:predicted ATP-grasp superfamily ATP-dependent carboligase
MVAEYASQMMPELAEEGAAILNTLQSGFRACGHKVHTLGYRGTDEAEFCKHIARTAQMCDAGIVVAPDYLLYDLTVLVETHTKNLGCPAGAVRKAADKLSSSLLLSGASLAVPEINPATGPYVLKPRYGCGSEGVRVVQSVDKDRLTDDMLVSKFVSGEHISVSLVIGKSVLPLSINKQLVHINGLIRYVGNVTPHEVDNPDAVLLQASQAAQLLGCKGYVGVDIVLQADGTASIVDVNARPTTAIVSINRVIGNVAEFILKAQFGQELPAFVRPTGTHTFLKRTAPLKHD